MKIVSIRINAAMAAYSRWATLLLGLALGGLGGCEEVDPQTLENAQALGLSEQALTAAEQDTSVENSEDADVDRPIRVTWLDDLSKGALVNASGFNMLLESMSRQTYTIEPSLTCYGFAGKVARIALDKIVLANDETTELRIPASIIPLQNINGAAALNLRFALTRQDSPEVIWVSAPPLYYRFNPGYAALSAIPEKAMVHFQDGLLFGGKGVMTAKTRLGRIFDGSRGFKEVWSDDAAFTIADKVTGKPVARVDEISVSVGHDDVPFVAQNMSAIEQEEVGHVE